MMEDLYGVDVAKNWIDVVGPAGHRRIANAQLDRFAAQVAQRGGRVVFEASGGYETPLREALAGAGVPALRVNPRRARAFATALGHLAKTDRVDAGMLRQMAQRLNLPVCPPEPKELSALKALQRRRRQLVEDVKRERIRAKQATCAVTRRSIERVLRVLSRETDQIEARIRALIAAHPVLQDRAALLQSAPGVGPVCTTALLADLPELGQLSPRQAAALAGLAPMARDSGLRSGQRRIMAGRKPLRDALYMAGLSASRHNPDLRAFAERLAARGKAPKQVIIAVTRKLLTILNAMVRENRPYQPKQ